MILLLAISLIAFGILLSVATAYADITQGQKDELLATTLQLQETELIKHTYLENPIYVFFSNSRYTKKVKGGHEIRFPVVLDKSDTFDWFGVGSTFNPQPKKILGWSHTELKQGAGHVTFEDVELWQASGPGNFVGMVEAKTEELEQSIGESLNLTAWGDGTEDGGLAPTGLTGHIPNPPTSGTYMGHDLSTENWGRCWYNDNETIGPHSLTSPTGNAPHTEGAIGDISDRYPLIIDSLNLMYASCVSNSDNKSDIFHITDLQTQLWYKQIPFRCPGFDIGVTEGPFNIGIETAHFMGSPIIPDTVDNGAIEGEWRMVNMRYYNMYIDTDHFFKWVGPRSPYNALRTSKYLVVRFQWVNKFPRKQGLLVGIATWQA